MSKSYHRNLLIFFTGICAFCWMLLLIRFANHASCPVYEPGSPALSAGGYSLCSLKLTGPSFTFHLEPSADPASLSLYVPNDRGCVLTVNGTTFACAPDQEYLICPLSDFVSGTAAADFHVTVTYPHGEDPYFGTKLLYLGSHSRILRLVESGSFQRFFVIGISFTILLYSLSLYAGKPSEKYLLFLALLAYTTSARTLWNALPALKHIPATNLALLGTVDFPGLVYALDYHLSFLVLKFLIAWLRCRLLREFVPVAIGRRPYIRFCAAALPAVLLACFLGHGYYAIQLWMLAVHLLEFYVLIRGGHLPTRLVLSAACGLTVALRLYDVACTLDLVSHGYLEAGLKPQGIMETFYIVAFVAVINLKFARKYYEADLLSLSLEETNRSLEAKVADRTRELSDTIGKLHEVQQQKLEFMTGILHNLKTPLFSLYGYTDMAIDELTDDPALARKHMQEVNRNADYVRQMIDNLFLCIRLEDGKVQYRPAPFPVSVLLEQLESTSLPKAAAEELTLEICPNPPKVTLNADLLYIRQAIQNIIDNAIRHSPPQSVIRILADTREKEGDCYVCLCVRDHGDGISAQELPLIFSRYYSGGKKGASSSGLGLTIARSIVVQHGGWIEVDSEPGRGTEFRVVLPAEKGERDPETV